MASAQPASVLDETWGAFPRTGKWTKRRRQSLRFALHNPLAVLAALVLVAAAVIVVFAAQLAPFDPNKANPLVRLQGPSSEHWFGTDAIGRDVMSRLIHGGRTSLRVAFTAVVASMVIGTIIGLVSGYWGGKADVLIQRVMETIQAFPALILAMFLVSLVGREKADIQHFWRDASLPITIIFIPGFVRVVRASVFATKNADYVAAANTIGAPAHRILVRHILPNISAPILVIVSLNFGFAILVEATLSFLGLGTQPPDPSWGAMLATDGRRFLNDHPHLVAGPAAVISLTVLAVNILGDTIRDVLDPELRNR